MDTIKFQGKQLEVKDNLFLPNGSVSLGVLRDNYTFFQKILNPLSDGVVSKAIRVLSKKMESEIMRISELTKMPERSKKLLVESENALFEAEKASIISNALTKGTSKKEIVQLCKSIFVSTKGINFDKVSIPDLSEAVESIKKKQLGDSSEKID